MPRAQSPGDQVVVEIEIAAPPERIFKALTDGTQLAAWWGAEPSTELIEFTMDARPGGKYRYRGRPTPGADHGAVGETLRRNRATEFECHGEVLEFVPPRLLVWSWIANWHEHPQHPTVVRWELEPTPTGTRVRVTHSALAREGVARKDYGQGWLGMLRLLRQFMEELQEVHGASDV